MVALLVASAESEVSGQPLSSEWTVRFEAGVGSQTEGFIADDRFTVFPVTEFWETGFSATYASPFGLIAEADYVVTARDVIGLRGTKATSDTEILPSGEVLHLVAARLGWTADWWGGSAGVVAYQKREHVMVFALEDASERLLKVRYQRPAGLRVRPSVHAWVVAPFGLLGFGSYQQGPDYAPGVVRVGLGYLWRWLDARFGLAGDRAGSLSDYGERTQGGVFASVAVQVIARLRVGIMGRIFWTTGGWYSTPDDVTRTLGASFRVSYSLGTELRGSQRLVD